MKFEDIIKKVSGTIAGLVVFFVAAGTYLSLKGFVMSSDGNIVLVKNAQASFTEGKASGEISTPVPADVNIILPKGHILGSKNAPLTIYEYSSFGCYHCAHFHLKTLPLLKKDFIDSGKVNLVFADFPLDKKSMQASLLADCLPEDKYFAFLNTVFKNQREWGLSFKGTEILTDYAVHAGLSREQAEACLKNDRQAEEIIADRQLAIEKLNVQGTPAFLIVGKDGKEVIHGVPDYEELKALLNRKLNK